MQYLQYMQANSLNYIISTLIAHSTLRDAILASPCNSFQQSWFIRLLVGDRDPLTAAKDKSVQCKRRKSVERSTLLQLLNQSWQGSASIDMRCSKENVCVCVRELVCVCVCAGVFQSTHCIRAYMCVYRTVCVCQAERSMRERQRERVSHTHTQEPVKGQRLVLTAQVRKWHTHTHTHTCSAHAQTHT